ENISCKECNQNYVGFSFSRRKLIAGSTIALLGYIGVHATLDEVKGYGDRYPIELEYALLDSCINGSRGVISESLLRSKRQACTCALEKTQEELPYKDYKEDKTSFASLFRRFSRTC
ncbi:MAG: hypothetical protein LPH21_08135, partial [Shewanella sp.]|nr:hypothetical protein [Shewanella sp.]